MHLVYSVAANTFVNQHLQQEESHLWCLGIAIQFRSAFGCFQWWTFGRVIEVIAALFAGEMDILLSAGL